MPCGNYLCERYGEHRQEWHKICQPCKGSGVEPGHPGQPCPYCDGTGEEG